MATEAPDAVCGSSQTPHWTNALTGAGKPPHCLKLRVCTTVSKYRMMRGRQDMENSCIGVAFNVTFNIQQDVTFNIWQDILV